MFIDKVHHRRRFLTISLSYGLQPRRRPPAASPQRPAKGPRAPVWEEEAVLGRGRLWEDAASRVWVKSWEDEMATESNNQAESVDLRARG